MSTDASPNPPPTLQELGAALGDKWLKLRIADHARLMGANQKHLDEGMERLKEDADYERRLNNALAASRFGGNWENLVDPPAKQGEEMKINIDSPTTINVSDPAMLERVLGVVSEQRQQSPPQPVQQPQQTEAPAAQPTTWKDTLKRYALPVLLGTAIGGAPLGWALSQYLGDKPASYEGYKYDVEKWIPEKQK